TKELARAEKKQQTCRRERQRSRFWNRRELRDEAGVIFKKVGDTGSTETVCPAEGSRRGVRFKVQEHAEIQPVSVFRYRHQQVAMRGIVAEGRSCDCELVCRPDWTPEPAIE